MESFDVYLGSFDGTFVFGLRNSCIMNAPRSQMRPDQKVSRAEEMILDCFLVNGLIMSLGQRHRHEAAANSGFRHHTPLHAELQAVTPVRRIEGKYSLEGKLQRKDAQSWRALADSVDSVRLTSGLQITQEDIRGEERKDEQRRQHSPKLTDIGCRSKVMPIVPRYLGQSRDNNNNSSSQVR